MIAYVSSQVKLRLTGLPHDCHPSRSQEGWTPAGPIVACLTPAVLPSLHTVRLSNFDISSAECLEQITAALREGALVHVKVR